MKKSIKIGLLCFGLIFLILVSYVVLTIAKIDYNHKIPIEKLCENIDLKIDFASMLKNIDLNDIKNKFPYDKYLQSGNYCNAEFIGKSLEELNTINPNQENVNRGVFIHALTSKLEERIATQFDHFNPDSLIILLQWIDEFKTYEKVDAKNGALYGIVHEHWMNFISNQLGELYEENPSIKFNFKFAYIQSVCESKRFSPAVGKSNLEKVVDYSLNQEYAYLFNRFWNGTHFLVKFGFVILFCLFIYMTYCTYWYGFKKQQL